MLEHDIDRPARRRHRLKVALITIWSVVLFVAVGAGGYYLLWPEPTITIAGRLSLEDPGGIDWGTPENPKPNCVGEGGYSDITAGAAVVIRDGQGETLAVGQLGAGATVRDEVLPIADRCDFSFTVEGVPAREFYSVEVTHRGAVTYSREQAAGGLQLTLKG